MTITTAVLLVMFSIDCISMFPELKKQYDTHSALIQELKANDGDVCMDYVPSYHRMVCGIVFDTWTYEKMCEKYGVSKINKIPKWQCLIESGEMFTDKYKVDCENLPKEIKVYNYLETIVISIPNSIKADNVTFSYRQAIYKKLPFIKTRKEATIALTEPYSSTNHHRVYAVTLGKRVRPAEINYVTFR